MNGDETSLCPWFERVSAMIDGELDDAQIPLVRAHAETCIECSRVRSVVKSPASSHLSTDFPTALPFERSRIFRAAAIVVGTLIVIGAFPGFIRGNTSGDALHDLRHLSIWQVAIGVAVASAGVTTRFSRLILILVGVFLLLTAVATMYDLITGHRGPWADPTHVVEVVAAVLLIRFALPLTRTGFAVTRKAPTR